MDRRPAVRAKHSCDGVEIERRVHRVARPSVIEREFEACRGGLRRTGPPKPYSGRRELFQARKTVGECG
jgi:hypothetical protein